MISVNRQALDREPIPIRPNSSRGEYIDHPFLVGRGGFGTYENAYNWVIESRRFELVSVPSGRTTRWGQRLACDSELFNALEDIRCLSVRFEGKEEILERPHPDCDRTLPGQRLRKPGNERYQWIWDLSTTEAHRQARFISSTGITQVILGRLTHISSIPSSSYRKIRWCAVRWRVQMLDPFTL